MSDVRPFRPKTAPPAPSPATPKFDAFMSELVAVIQRYMPWPFIDVDRDDAEGRETAEAIAQALIPTLAKEFDDLRGGAEKEPT